MSKIANAKGRQDGNSGYSRAIGNEQLGQLLSRVQSTIISNGTELERMIVERSNIIENIDIFIEKASAGSAQKGVYLCLKKTFKMSNKFAQSVKGIEPDMLIFIVGKTLICKVIELKDGDMFDTKKAIGEKEHLERFSMIFGAQIPFVTKYFMCSFNQNDKNIIFTGFKGCFGMEHLLTGRELCEILCINYDEIRDIRKQDSNENFAYFIQELCKIPEVVKAIKAILK